VMTTSKGTLECRYGSAEALTLFAWLYMHRDALYCTALVDEAQKAHRLMRHTPRPKVSP